MNHLDIVLPSKIIKTICHFYCLYSLLDPPRPQAHDQVMQMQSNRPLLTIEKSTMAGLKRLKSTAVDSAKVSPTTHYALSLPPTGVENINNITMKRHSTYIFRYIVSAMTESLQPRSRKQLIKNAGNACERKENGLGSDPENIHILR